MPLLFIRCMGVTLYSLPTWDPNTKVWDPNGHFGTPISVRPFQNGGPCNPEIRKRGPIARIKNANERFIQGCSKKKVYPKAPMEGRPHREDLKKVNESFIQGGPKKGSTKEVEAH